MTVGPLLAASLKPLTHRQNLASLSIFYNYYFNRCSSELLYSCRKSTCYSDRLHGFSITISRCCKDFYVNSFFSYTAGLWNSLPTDCFPLIYHLLALSIELTDTFCLWVLSKQLFYIFIIFSSFPCNSMPRSYCSTLHGVNHN